MRLGGRWGVLLTLQWMELPLAEQPEPLQLGLVFHYAEAHPQAPPAVQALVETLQWQSTSLEHRGDAA